MTKLQGFRHAMLGRLIEYMAEVQLRAVDGQDPASLFAGQNDMRHKTHHERGWRSAPPPCVYNIYIRIVGKHCACARFMAQSAQVLDLTDPDETDKIRNELIDYFQNRRPHWSFIRPLGDGENAVAILVRERNPYSPGRLMVVKRAKSGEAPKASLKKEIEYLTLLASWDGSNPRKISSFLRVLSNKTQRFETPASLAFWGLEDPIIGLEYLQNGTISQLMNRLREHDLQLPNRALWSFFLCCLSHPPMPSTVHGRRLETMTDGTTLNLIHGDLHGDNIMIGKQYDSPTFPEHTLLPPMKLIDLGEAYEGGPGAAAENIHKVSLRILSLIARRHIRPREKSTYKDYETLATEILPHGNGRSYPALDNDLRDLIAQCASTDRGRRPTLEELLAATQDGARKDPDTYKPNDTRETDSAIQELMKKVLYDAHSEQVDTSVAAAVLGEGGAMEGGDSEGRDSPTAGNKRIFSIGTLSLGSLRIPKRR